MFLSPANYFQLYDDQHADFELGANGRKLSIEEKYLWLNIELYSKVIKEAGLQDKLEAAYEQALKDFATIANERDARYAATRRAANQQALKHTATESK